MANLNEKSFINYDNNHIFAFMHFFKSIICFCNQKKQYIQTNAQQAHS